MACLRFCEGSLLPFTVGGRLRKHAALPPDAGQAQLVKAEASHPHSKFMHLHFEFMHLRFKWLDRF